MAATRATGGVIAASLLVLPLAGCSSGGPSEPSDVVNSLAAQASSSGSAPSAGELPHPAHVVVVVEENHSYADVIGSSDAPFLNTLAGRGALFTASYAVAHPSEPNYLALFSGSTQGLTGDSCPHTFTGSNLGSELLAGGLGFTGYSESMPSTGYTGCGSGDYARKHNPWSNFPALPADTNRTWADFPHDYTALPTVSFVIPNLAHDMHNGTVRAGDDWLRAHLSDYATWAPTHDSLLVVTWDEDDNGADNHIPTIITGAGVKPGRYPELLDHYRALRTLTTMYGLSPVGEAAKRTPITDIWQR
ncbi:alkaline phosphatase family protein [Nocardia sp. NPDC020380]|uniref:alkaline phosphatase family protein n=1 Tax=Nocardia sp. NPDC020380 TaxID=3364309 RepID=UPI0037ABE6FE